MISSYLIRIINARAMKLHQLGPSRYRRCTVRAGKFVPPDFRQVPYLMDSLVRRTNASWPNGTPLALAASLLWGIGYIHPFIDGNGRTQRALAYLAICIKLETWLPGRLQLPELLYRNRSTYLAALKVANKSYEDGTLDLSGVEAVLLELLKEQVAGTSFSLAGLLPAISNDGL